jgi:hypothetical protein
VPSTSRSFKTLSAGIRGVSVSSGGAVSQLRGGVPSGAASAWSAGSSPSPQSRMTSVLDPPDG